MKNFGLAALIFFVSAGALFVPSPALAQCPNVGDYPTGQLDYDFATGSLRQILDQMFVNTSGATVWSGTATPLYTLVPQSSPDFYNIDLDGNGIKDNDHYDMLAAIVNGDSTVYGGALTEPEATAIRNAFNANRDLIKTKELTLFNIRVTTTVLIIVNIDFTKNFVTGQDNQLTQADLGALVCGQISGGCPTTFRIPSLWSNPIDGNGLLAEVSPEFEQRMLDIGAAILTIGDATAITWFQNFIGRIAVASVERIIPQLLASLKDIDDKEPGWKIPCTGIAALDLTVPLTLSGISANVRFRTSAANLCASATDLADKFSVAGGFITTNNGRLGATGNLNNGGSNNVTSYNNAGQNRQAWLAAEGLTNTPLQFTTLPGPTVGFLGLPHTLSFTTAGGSGAITNYEWELIDSYRLGRANTSATITLLNVLLDESITINRRRYVGHDAATAGTAAPGLGGRFDRRGTDAQDATQLNNLFANAAWNIGIPNVTKSVSTNVITLTRQANGYITNWGNSGTFTFNLTPYPNRPNQATLTTWLTGGTIAAIDAGQYTVRICDSKWTRRSVPITLTTAAAPLQITTHPNPLTAIVGDNLTPAFTVVAGGGTPAYTYQWQFDDLPINGVYNNVAGTLASFSISNVQSSQEGNYRVRVRDSAAPTQGEVFSNPAYLTVLLNFGITQQPVNTSGVVGGGATLSVRAGGSIVPITYQWEFDNVPIDGNYVNVSAVPSTADDLVFTSLTLADAGNYRCKVTGDNGSGVQTLTSSVAGLSVAPQVSILTQPNGANLNTQGPGHTFSVTAQNGLPPYHYQWQFDNLPIDGSYANVGSDLQTFQRNPPLVAHQGNYRVLVTDSSGVGSATSSVVPLTVLGPGVLPASPQSFVGGGPISIPVNPQGGAVAVPGDPSSYTYQWFFDAAGAPVSFVPLGTQTSNTLSIPISSVANAGTYQCLITDTAAQGVIVNVDVIILDPIVITLAPAGNNLVLNENHTFTVNATGGGTGGNPPLTYAWTFDDGVSGYQPVGANQNSLSISGAQVADQGLYRVTISDGVNPSLTVTSTPVELTVLSIGTPPPGAITVAVGDPIVIDISPEGGDVAIPGDPASYTYVWEFDDDFAGPNPFVVLGSQTSSQLNIPISAESDSGTYRVTVSDNAPRSVQASVNVTSTVDPIILTVHPISKGRLRDTQAQFSAGATGGNFPVPGNLQFTWQHEPLAGGGYTNVTIGGTTTVSNTPTTSTLTRNLVQPVAAGRYRCVVTDGVGATATTNIATLYVGRALTEPPAPVGGKFHTGDTHSPILSAAASNGVGPLRYQWQYRPDAFSVFGPVGGATGATLNLGTLILAEAGQYRNTVFDVGVGDGPFNAQGFPVNPANYTPTGNFTTNAAVIEVGPPLDPNPPVDPAGTTLVSTGADVQITVNPTGGLPPLTYQWYDDSKAALPGANAPTLTLNDVDANDEGDYYCEVTDAVGGPQGFATSQIATIIVAAPLTISQHPAGFTIVEGQNGQLQVAATGGISGGSGYAYEWRRGGQPITSPRITGINSNTLVFTAAEPIDSGSYACTVTDGSESATSNPASVTVDSLDPLEIVDQPDDITIQIGGDGSMTVVAVSPVGGLTYQWYKDGDLLTGENNPTILFTEVDFDDAGLYFCEVADFTDSVTSDTARLTVRGGLPVAGPLGLAALALAAGLMGITGLRRRR